MKNQALEVLADRANTAGNSARRRRSEATTIAGARFSCMAFYREGEAIAYTDARKVMEAELRRLCNLFQNGALTLDSFGLNL